MDLIRNKNSIIDFIPGKDVGDLLGEKTYFRGIVLKLIDTIVNSGNWFSFATKVNDSQIDIFSLKNKDGNKLGSLVFDEVGSDNSYRTTLYRYLLHDYLCYCEVPSVVRQRDYSGFRDSYSKYLVTSNIGVIANWLGISYAEAKMFYGSRVEDNGFDREDGMYPYVKLYTSKDGTRKVSKPRKDIDLSEKGIRIIPLFALKRGVECLYKVCSEDFHNVTFVKDSGQIRTLNICFDYNKLSSIYNDKGLLADAFLEQFKGDFLNIETFERGFIRVIEVGTNLRSSAVRSLNVARILKIEKAEPDLTFINIDLDTVKSSFLNMVSNQNVNYNEFVNMLDIFQVGNKGEYNGSKISSYSELESWVEQQEMLMSTPFIKQLALFMLGNPQWFNGYTGEAKHTEISDLNDDIFSDEIDFEV